MKTITTNKIEVSKDILLEKVRELFVDKKYALKTIAATDERAVSGVFKIHYVFGSPSSHDLVILILSVKEGHTFPTIGSIVHAAFNYEHKIHTFFGLVPDGHKSLQSWNLHDNWPEGKYPLRKDFDWKEHPVWAKAKHPYQMSRVEGEGVYELPVGPIHAGIIEPGHFRFNLAGEEILLLEAHLGYVHKGSEKLFETLNIPNAVKLSEKISGDSSFSHSLAFCEAIENLAGMKVPSRAQYLRVIFAELERIANHTGDIGAIMLDTGFNFGGTNGSRLREIILRLNEKLTGSRFLRGVNVIGGVTRDIDEKMVNVLRTELAAYVDDFNEVIQIALTSASLLNRLERTGITTENIVMDLGIVGIAAKAVGFHIDARVDYPYAAYSELNMNEVVAEKTGDVYARYMVRVREVEQSVDLVRQALDKLPKDKHLAVPMPSVLPKDVEAVQIVEGWRGDIVYFVKTDESGKLARVDVRDPSFLNWTAVGLAGPGNIVPDFPLINKSFNMSYSGNDL